MSLTEAQLAERLTGIGGSDAAPALGLSPWKSPLELFLDKRERRLSIETPAMRWGTLLEPVIRQAYSDLTGRVVRLPPGTMRHAKHAFMLAHFDGVTDDGRIFEAKTARSADGWGVSGTDEIPHHYLLQVQHYMAVSGLRAADVAVLIGGSDFRIYEIANDPDLQEMIIDGEREFWELVERGEPPPPDFDVGDIKEILRRLFRGTNGQTAIATADDFTYRRTYEHAHNAMEVYKRLADGAKAHLLFRMGEAACITFDDGVQFTRKIVTRKGYTVEPTEYVDARFSKLKELPRAFQN